MPIYLPILLIGLIWAIMASSKPLVMLSLLVRSIAAATVVAAGLFELGWIPAVRLIYFNNDIRSLQAGYAISVFVFGLSLGLKRMEDISRRQRFVVAFSGPLLAMPIFFPMVVILSRWNNPRSYAPDLTDMIGAGVVLLPGPIPALIGCAVGGWLLSATAFAKRGGAK